MNQLISSYTLASNPNIKELSHQKYNDVLQDEFASERECYIERLCHEVTILNEKIFMDAKEHKTMMEELDNKKRKYKIMAKASKASEDAAKLELKKL